MQIGVDSQRAVENRRIFVVAEDEILRAAVQFMLHDEYETHEFAALDPAFVQAASGPPELIVLDAQLLATDPLAILDRWQRTAPGATLLLAGDAAAEPVDALAGIGVIPMPLRVESLRAAVTGALGRATNASAR